MSVTALSNRDAGIGDYSGSSLIRGKSPIWRSAAWIVQQ